jgi:hypothetical protein
LFKKENSVVKSKEMKTGCNLEKSFGEGCGSKRAVLMEVAVMRNQGSIVIMVTGYRLVFHVLLPAGQGFLTLMSHPEQL